MAIIYGLYRCLEACKDWLAAPGEWQEGIQVAIVQDSLASFAVVAGTVGLPRYRLDRRDTRYLLD